MACITSPCSLRVASTPSSLYVAAPPSPPDSTPAYQTQCESLSPSSNSASTRQTLVDDDADKSYSKPSNGNQRESRIPSFDGHDNNNRPILCVAPKRVEDVKLNRIDKCRSSRRRKNFCRPFVFKSSPLAEGQSARRLNLGIGNPFTRFSKANTFSRSTLSLADVSQDAGSWPYGVNNSLGTMPPTSPLVISKCPSTPPALDAFSASPPLISPFATRAALSGRGRSPPQIARSHTADPSSKRPSVLSHAPTPEHQTWEIALPKCILLNFGSQN